MFTVDIKQQYSSKLDSPVSYKKVLTHTIINCRYSPAYKSTGYLELSHCAYRDFNNKHGVLKQQRIHSDHVDAQVGPCTVHAISQTYGLI